MPFGIIGTIVFTLLATVYLFLMLYIYCVKCILILFVKTISEVRFYLMDKSSTLMALRKTWITLLEFPSFISINHTDDVIQSCVLAILWGKSATSSNLALRLCVIWWFPFTDNFSKHPVNHKGWYHGRQSKSYLVSC